MYLKDDVKMPQWQDPYIALNNFPHILLAFVLHGAPRQLKSKYKN